MPDDLKAILEALPEGGEVQLTATKDEYGRTITVARTASRTVTLDHDATLRVGAAHRVGRAS